MNDQAHQKKRVRPPVEDIVLDIVDQETLNQRKQTTEGWNVDYDFQHSDFAWRGELFLNWGDQSDVAKNHGSDRTNSVR